MTTRTYESLAQAAQRTEVSVKTLRRRIAAGQLTAYRYGPRMLRLDPRDVDQLIVAPAHCADDVTVRIQEDPMTTNSYLSLPRAAERRGMTLQSLRQLVATGELRAYSIGPRIIRVDIRDIDRLEPSAQPRAHT